MKKIKILKSFFKDNKIDGYIVPKNDEFFNEYIPENKDNLKFISKFSGSYGFALILKNRNYLFVDGRYTLQAKIQCGKFFKILTLPKTFPSDILKNKKITIGYDPKLHTDNSIKYLFKNCDCSLLPLKENLINKIWIRKKKVKLLLSSVATRYRQNRSRKSLFWLLYEMVSSEKLLLCS